MLAIIKMYVKIIILIKNNFVFLVINKEVTKKSAQL